MSLKCWNLLENGYFLTQFCYQMLWAWRSLLVALGFKNIKGNKNLCIWPLLPLQPITMAPKNQNMLRMTLPTPNLVENCLSYGKTNFLHNFASKSGELELTPTKSRVFHQKWHSAKSVAKWKMSLIKEKLYLIMVLALSAIGISALRTVMGIGHMVRCWLLRSHHWSTCTFK